MGVKEQMISILKSGETQRISFSFTGSTGATVSVDARSFARVADALRSGSIAVVEGRFPNDIAMYSARNDTANGFAANTFYLGNNPRYSRLFNALICHEAVHASFDLTRSAMPWVDNEAAGYIAQAYYARNSGLPRMAYEFGSHAIHAYSIVENMRARNTSDVAFFLGVLRDSLAADPMYHSYIGGQFSGDG
ncbi:MAG: hypothetical protein KA956_02625 [Pyrinomonadaceae bacterium]|nr:hypothetical protein [Acidobacteriota bacterium]MBK7932302.1 hypothetical protein [Acidobacteriota bacterium]MBP7375353.1 hypothetical protein [Pyrinomonadaceae bacterium]